MWIMITEMLLINCHPAFMSIHVSTHACTHMSWLKSDNDDKT